MEFQESQQQNQKHKGSTELPSAFDLFGPSWQAFKKNWVIFIFGILVPTVGILALVALLQVVAHFAFSGNGASTNNSGFAALNVLSVILGAGAIIFAFPLATSLYYYTKLASAKGVRLSYWPSLKASLHYFWRILGLAIVRWLVIIVGLILLIVPGLFMWRRYMLAPYYLMDEDLKISEAMRRSAADSSVFSSALWGLMGVYLLVSVASAIFNILPVIGWIAGIALSIVTLCMASIRYYQIKEAI